VNGLPGGIGVGEVIGNLTTSTARNVYWIKKPLVISSCVGMGGGVLSCTGLSSDQSKQQASFSGFDFSTVWAIDANASFPYLRANEKIPHPSAAFTSPSLNANTIVDDPAAAPNQVITSLTALTQPPARDFAQMIATFERKQVLAEDR